MKSLRVPLAVIMVPLITVGMLSALSVPASAASGGSTHPHGLDALSNLDKLPYLDPEMRSGMDSSAAKDGGYRDHDGWLYIDTKGNSNENDDERFYTDLRGPGEITRMWATALISSDVLKVYFDGESTPRINMPALDFFNGTNGQFLSPLVLNSSQSSGGWVSNLPLKFSQSIRISITGPGHYDSNNPTFPPTYAYLQANYQQFTPDTTITSWSATGAGAEDSTAVRSLFSHPGTDPKPSAATSPNNGTVNLAAGATSTIYNVAGAHEITSLKIKLPQLTTNDTSVDDNGLAFKTFSQFTIHIDPTAAQVFLTRRLDYGVSDQSAVVSVDGVAQTPNWTTPGHNTGGFFDTHFTRWLDSTYPLPVASTAGKSSVVIKIAYAAGNPDWNEFTYWADSKSSNGSLIKRDQFNVKDPNAVTTNNYQHGALTADNISWHSYYRSDPNIAAVLNQLTVTMNWDNATTPAVKDVPLGSFFAIGNYGYALAPNTLMVGVDSSGWLYMYFPMPYQSSGVITLHNTGSTAVNGVAYAINYGAAPSSFDKVGYFTTDYKQQSVASTTRHDVTLLDRDGQGTVMGLVLSAKSEAAPNAVTPVYPEPYINPNDGTNTLSNYQIGYWGFIEGDEKVYVDGSATPSVIGTGVEDFDNAGFGWSKDFDHTATAGLSNYYVDPAPAGSGNYVSYTGLHRIMLEDRINFTNHVTWNLEHGLVNDFGIAQLDTLVYLYFKPTVRTIQTDQIDVGDPASETAHAFSAPGATAVSGVHSFEGTYRDVFVPDDGKSTHTSFQFSVKVDPSNQGLVLRNRIDQANVFQDANVKIDGADAGIWRIIGGNTSDSRWKENDFMVPTSLTTGKSSVTVTLTRSSSSDDLTSFQITAFSTLPGAGAAPPPPPGSTTNIANPSFEDGTLSGWTATGSAFGNAQVVSDTTAGGQPFGQAGTKELFGLAPLRNRDGDRPTGSMRTAPFILGGDGKISFLISGGKDITNENLELVRASDDKVLMEATGWNYDPFKRVVMDASTWVGTSVYLKAVDSSDAVWGHLNLDDFHVPVSTLSTNLLGTWKQVGSNGTWIDVDAGLQGTATGDSFKLTSQTASNFVYEGDLTLKSAGAATLIFRADSTASHFYAVNIGTSPGSGNVLFWGPGGIPDHSAAFPISTNATYHVKVAAEGSHIRVWVGSGAPPLLDFTDTTLSSGQLGVNVWNGTAVFQNLTLSTSSDTWTTAWASSMAEAKSLGAGASNASCRVFARVSLSGPAVRVRLSNKFSASPLTFNAVSVGLRSGSKGVQSGTLRTVTFGGSTSTTLAPGADVMSDPIPLTVIAGQDLAVSTFSAGSVPVYTNHEVGLVSHFCTTFGGSGGDQTASLDGAPLTDASSNVAWVSAVDVNSRAGAVVAFGDSITDGYAAAVDSYTSYPAQLAQRAEGLSSGPAVLNAGISGNMVSTSGGTGPVGTTRITDEVLKYSGVRSIVLLLGTNDLGTGTTAATVLTGLKSIAQNAHANGVRVYVGTIPPRDGAWGGGDAAKDSQRATLNQSIRTEASFDGVIDFDAVLRNTDPSYPGGGADYTQYLSPSYSADGLHPNSAGYSAMANAISTTLIAP